jgi:hypothetical protein
LYNNGKMHNIDIDPETGFMYCALNLPENPFDDRWDNLFTWSVNGKVHRDDIDPKTGLTLPAKISEDGKEWKKEGVYHRDDMNPETGKILPAILSKHTKTWLKNGVEFYP